jgi:hypothetical protein
MRDLKIGSKWRCTCGCKSTYVVLDVDVSREEIFAVDQLGIKSNFNRSEFTERILPNENGVELMIKCL